MKKTIFTYNALKALKEQGGNLSWDDISPEQLRYLYIDEGMITANIEDLYNVSRSKVSYKRKKFGASFRSEVDKHIYEDEANKLDRLVTKGEITKKERDELLGSISHFLKKIKKPEVRTFEDEVQANIINRNDKAAESSTHFFNQIFPANNNVKRLSDNKCKEELKNLLRDNYNDFLEINDKLGEETWVKLFKTDEDFSEFYFSVIVPNEDLYRLTLRADWNINPYDSSGIYNDKEDLHIIGLERKIKPVVILREFCGLRDSYAEILEEIRFFYGLYFDRNQNKYLKINDDGTEEDVIIVKDSSEVLMQRKYLRKFLSAKDMTLVIYFDIRKRIKYGFNSDTFGYINETYSNSNVLFNISITDMSFLDENDDNEIIRYYGKKFIRGYSSELKFPEADPYNVKQYEEFIVDIDEYDNCITFSCNPDLLRYNEVHKQGINFDKKVFFDKGVLKKYYDNHSLFTVADKYVKCANQWELPIEYAGKNYVVISLGNLGRILSLREQHYWKSYNIPPAWDYNGDKSLSVDEKFKEAFKSFQNKWVKQHKWYLFKPLLKQDAHHLHSLHIPLFDNQREFDEQILSLVKIMIDSLNDKELNKLTNKKCSGSIDKLKTYLEIVQLQGYDTHIEFLKKLQCLRSTSVAHRKGKNYKKISEEFNMCKKSLPDVYKDILSRAVEFLNYLERRLIL
ncbi:MAG: hypothetical protein LBK53_09505 [Heliobacteriaceae bacterium]|jgi:hypothetical protein|nr:hypothetical protein [Heliobacteriaceae bacterium]